MSFNIFQLAYVTDDIDAAVRHAGAAMGIGAFQVNRSMAIETGEGIAIAHFALAFLGETQIEIIQPAGGADAVYRDGIRQQGGALSFHHVGALITDEAAWQATVRAIEQSGEAVPVRGAFGDVMHYLYVDRRATLGHYCEYMWRTPAGAGIFDAVPRH
jgi:hypothetical protein